MDKFNPDTELLERLSWLINLRWLALGGVVITIIFSHSVLRLNLPLFSLGLITAILGIYNLLFYLCLPRVTPETTSELYARASRSANWQIAADLIALATLIHFSGGIENPFIFYFIFHMIIASSLLSRRASFRQATFAVTLFFLVAFLEYYGILAHYGLGRFITNDQYQNAIYITGVAVVFTTTLYIAVYLATSITTRLRQRERILEETNELLKEKDRVKSEYVLRVTHDIKEHLAAIQGCLEPVIIGLAGELNPPQFDLIQRATLRTGKLTQFVKALLEITRIKLSQEFRMEYFPIKEAVDNALSFISLKAENKDIKITTHIDPQVDKIRGAKEYIQEVMVNLLANSVKYTPRHGRIELTIIDRGNEILLAVKDTGIGIPKEELSMIFEEFHRADNAKAVERDGTGLGLSLVKQIVEGHNGTVWVESEEGKGSAFFVTLPK
ncbi:MAG: HAMP domain-containing histidine kinase [Elusimicrobia bacterium]|nr:HAMP domain-containing histidine kinase [Elusimicrobiota bacterium]